MARGPVLALEIIGGMILIVLLLLFGFRTTQSNMDRGNEAIAKAEQVIGNLEESEYTQYDGAVITGTQVLQLIRENQMKNNGISVIVKTGTETTYKSGEAEDTFKANIKNAKDRSNGAYILPSASFIGSIVRDSNTKAILEVHFDIL